MRVRIGQVGLLEGSESERRARRVVAAVVLGCVSDPCLVCRTLSCIYIVVVDDFKPVSLLKKKRQGRRSDGQLGVSGGVFVEEQTEVGSHSSSQQSLTSYEEGDMVNFDPFGGPEPPVCSKSVDQLLEDACEATKHVLGLTSKEEEEEEEEEEVHVTEGWDPLRASHMQGCCSDVWV